MKLNEGDPTLRKDREPRLNAIGVFIDDEKAWGKIFSRPFLNLPSFTPIVIESFFLRELIEELARIQPDLVSVVITDQFFDNYPFKDEVNKFLKKVRRSNPNAWIVETSGAPQDKMFTGSNRVLNKSDLYYGLKKTRVCTRNSLSFGSKSLDYASVY